MVMITKALVCVLAMMASLSSVACAAVTLVADGKTDYVIVLSNKASVSETFAAKELADHIKLISGATLPIKTSDGNLPAKAIVLGNSPAVTALGTKVDLDALGTDGYVIKTTGDRLVIVGGAKRGTLFGVYTLLESFGVRWWYPRETDIPKMRTITVPDTDLREVPKLEYRDMMFNENYSAWLWMARNKLNGMAWDNAPAKVGGRYKFVGNLVHSYNLLLKKSGHEITDDMKALVKGKRTFAQPCLSSEKTLAAMVDGVLKAFKEMPDARFVVVGQMDNDNYCRCPECAAIDKKEASHAGQVIRFANRVAEEVEKRRPGSAICTAAYGWSRKPPKNLKPRDNVRITLCSIECDFAHPLVAGSNPENKTFKDDIVGWGKIARKIFIWHYVGNRDHYLMPNAEIETLVPNMKFFADNGCAGVFNQGTHRGTATDMTMLKQWVLARAMWNPERDSRKLIEEFCNGFYGPAGDDVLRAIDILHATAHKQDFHNGRRVHMSTPYLKPEIIADAEVALRAAEAKVAGNDVFARRVRHAHMGIWYILAKRGPASNTWKAVEAKVGKLDATQLADNLARVVREWKVNCICDPVEVGEWIKWVKHYMALVTKQGHAPLPPELAGKNPSTYTLVQACQFDMTPKWWKPAEGASDGYAIHVPKSGWYTHYRPMAWEGVVPGKTYKVFIRAKGDLKPGAKGDVWDAGVYPRGKSMSVTAEQLADGKWHVFELGPWKFAKGQFWWTALRRNPKGAKSVAIDCIWFVEVPKG
jgi:uncharacterized protein DUF4838/glycosyl hydrolase family 67